MNAMEEEVNAFREAGMSCEGLSDLETRVNAHVDSIEKALDQFEGPSWAQWRSMLEPISDDMALIKEKSLRKLGEACCKSKEEDCKEAVLKVLESVKAVKRVTAETLSKLPRDFNRR